MMGDKEKKTEQKKGKGGIVLVLLLILAAGAFYFLNSGAGSTEKMPDTGVMYAKDNDLYYYDLANEPYLVQENISSGGNYHYYFGAWGAELAKDGSVSYYMANIDASALAELYCRDMKDPAAVPVLIDTAVRDFMISEDGSTAAYLKMVNDTVELRVYSEGESWVVSREMQLADEAVYVLSKDGRYVVYEDAYGILRATSTANHSVPVALTVDSPMYLLADEADMLYYVSKTDTGYDIYSYDFGEEIKLVAENASYMELMPNGKDLLYGVKMTELVPYSELIVDDMAEIDANIQEGDDGYDLKMQRELIREAAANGEGIEPMLMEFYLYADGKATLAVDNVVSAVAVADSEKSYVVGYKARDFQPIYLSVIGGGLEMVDTIYYMSINYGGMEPFLADGKGNVEVLAGSGVMPDSIKISADGKKAAYLATDQETGANVLMQMKVGKGADATAVQMNVDEFAFLGGNGPLCYYYDYADGTGTLASAESETVITDASGVEFASDLKQVYYIANLDSTTGVGQMQHWDGKGEPVTVDGNVFAFQYKGNGKATVIYDYDVHEQTGDLGYYNGEGVTMLAEGITGIFID